MNKDTIELLILGGILAIGSYFLLRPKPVQAAPVTDSGNYVNIRIDVDKFIDWVKEKF